MNLGTLISRLEDESQGAAALEALGDIVLFSEVREMADAFGETIGGYVATSAGRFAAGAGDETWLSLIGAIERAPQPGQTALRRMLRWALDSDAQALREESTRSVEPAKACTCGGGHCGG